MLCKSSSTKNKPGWTCLRSWCRLAHRRCSDRRSSPGPVDLSSGTWLLPAAGRYRLGCCRMVPLNLWFAVPRNSRSAVPPGCWTAAEYLRPALLRWRADRRLGLASVLSSRRLSFCASFLQWIPYSWGQNINIKFWPLSSWFGQTE